MKMAESSPKEVENTAGKGEIACNDCRQVKTRACLGKGQQNK